MSLLSAVNRRLLFTFHILLLSFFVKAQSVTRTSAWGAELKAHKAFVENKGQFNYRNFEGADQTV
ncbi:MAG: hypothetical protein JKX73_11420 [Flavobacteriales bacterium]|nr:hypothetical protein [Flavobacteriales bacterium]